ncbi:MAG: hypothetical protein NT061_09630 [Spirochaetes bacterium]|nr:hypothetical protein [Spirochaetota bacterium]
MKRSFFVGMVLTISICCVTSVFAIENENSVLIDTGRVFHGASTGTRYYGYTGGTITLPSKVGGVLSFDIWNDIPISGTSILNYFRTEIAGQKISFSIYSTSSQVVEPYNEDKGWGASGIQRVRLGIPAGMDKIQFDNTGSQTGIELSNIKFAESVPPPQFGWAVDTMRDAGVPVIEVGRVLNGKKTGTKYYGYTNGTIHLPHGNGGFLSFKFWNDQYKGQTWTLDKLNLTVGTRRDIFEQYTTSMDLREFYAEFDNDNGPAGGGEITIQLPEGITKVQFDNTGSTMGLEISDVSFTKGTPVMVSFREKPRNTDQVLVDLGRVFNGKTTGRKYYGYNSGTIILPDNRGGTLYFRLWNDHPGDSPMITNTLILKAGTATQAYVNLITLKEKSEVYNEDGGWGPSGGRELSFQVPAGAGVIEVHEGQSETGIELSDLRFITAR